MALWKRAVLAFVLVLSAAVALAPSAGPQRTIARGVRVAGVNMAGLDAVQARQQIIGPVLREVALPDGRSRWTAPTDRLRARRRRGRMQSRGLPGPERRQHRACGSRPTGARSGTTSWRSTSASEKPAKNASSSGSRQAAGDQQIQLGPRRTSRDDDARDRAHAQEAHPAAPAARDEAAQADDLAREVRAGHHHPARLEPPRALQRDPPRAHVPRRDRTGAVPDADRRSASSTCSRTPGGVRPTPTGPRG